ncbi:uncharacterized protein P174DRAFT_201542 [Aspergillus novofumigatus IBT 16806]|uniref:Uncharacterized protein n=1 Tax=Aspergillus novofumigatus (strain IBT 16806) TaxID=1392255 RepID=A0A2I1C4C4_ASPN1|nr:uncharacterized protein P174DRAFT_201542 [Aspergillus novofumigatus IBT 16806]PKX92490.1 hypothetical protein P174DRAFT_201542 [Aspergillus novofumigatus IBT 16806]
METNKFIDGRALTESNNNSKTMHDASVFSLQVWFQQGDSMVLDGSFGRTQRISQSEEGKPHSTVSLSSSHRQSAQNGHFTVFLWVCLSDTYLIMLLMQALILSFLT